MAPLASCPVSGPCSAAQSLGPRLQGGQFNPFPASGCLPYPLTTGSRNWQGCLGLSSSRTLGGLLPPSRPEPTGGWIRARQRDPAPCSLPPEGEPKRLVQTLPASSVTSPLAAPARQALGPQRPPPGCPLLLGVCLPTPRGRDVPVAWGTSTEGLAQSPPVCLPEEGQRGQVHWLPLPPTPAGAS